MIQMIGWLISRLKMGLIYLFHHFPSLLPMQSEIHFIALTVKEWVKAMVKAKTELNKIFVT